MLERLLLNYSKRQIANFAIFAKQICYPSLLKRVSWASKPQKNENGYLHLQERSKMEYCILKWIFAFTRNGRKWIFAFTRKVENGILHLQERSKMDICILKMEFCILKWTFGVTCPAVPRPWDSHGTGLGRLFLFDIRKLACLSRRPAHFGRKLLVLKMA